MDHDPLCPFIAFVRYTGPCQCDLIAKVRADERNRVFTHLDALADRDHTEGCPSLTCTGCAESSAEGVQIVQ